MKKGIIFSILALMLGLSVLTLAGYYAAQTFGSDISLEKTRAIFDDIESDLEDLWGVSSSVSYDSGDVTVTFFDTFPLEDGVTRTLDYKDYFEGQAGKLNSNVKVAFGSPYFTLAPTTVVYGYPSYDKEGIRVYNATGDAAGVSGYDINVYADKNYINVTTNITAGNLRLRFNSTFQNGGGSGEYLVSRTAKSDIVFNLQDSKITVSVGGNTIDGVGRNGSLVIGRSGNVTPQVTTRITLAGVNDVGVKTNVRVDLTDVISRSDYIWLTPQTTEGAEFAIPTTTTTTSTTVTTTTTTTSSTTTTTTTTATTTTTSTSSSTTTTTTTSTTTTTIQTCDGYCISRGQYTAGTCRANQQQCTNNGETWEPGGDPYCTGGPSQDTCCCRP